MAGKFISNGRGRNYTGRHAKPSWSLRKPEPEGPLEHSRKTVRGSSDGRNWSSKNRGS